MPWLHVVGALRERLRISTAKVCRSGLSVGTGTTASTRNPQPARPRVVLHLAEVLPVFLLHEQSPDTV